MHHKIASKMSIIVNTQQRTIIVSGVHYPCRIGSAGAINYALGREGDKKTPLGSYALRFGFYRADRLPRPRSKLNLLALEPADGWCDAPDDTAYNRFVRLPYDGSCEALWREDGAYDVIIVISHNDSPPAPNLGSAVFIHIAQPDDRQTLGCIAVSPDVMLSLLSNANCGQSLTIL